MNSDELKADREEFKMFMETELKVIDDKILRALIAEEQEYVAYFAYEGYDWSEDTTTEPLTKGFETLEQARNFLDWDDDVESSFRIEGPKDKATGNRPVVWE